MGLETIDWQFLVFGALHILGIAVYVGGSVAMEFVLGPAQAAIPPAQAQVMGEKSANRFLWLVWGSLALIIVTGVLRLERTGFLNAGWPPTRGLLTWEFSYGRTLFAMVIIWLLLVINGLIITFVLRPRLTGRLAARTSAARVTESLEAKLQAAQWVQRLTRTDIVLALSVAVFGASLRLGGLL